MEKQSKRKYSTEQIINLLGCGWFQVYVFFVASFVSMCEGCELMALTLLMPTLRYHWDLTSFQESMIGTVIFCGFFLSFPLFGFFSDNCGRKPAVITGVIVIVIAGTISALCDQYVLFILVRFFVGLCVGVNHVALSLLIEFMPNRGRGTVASLGIGAWGFGSLFVSVLAWIVIPNIGENSWQLYVFLTTVPMLIALPFLICLPESMRFQSFHYSSNPEKVQKKMRRTIRQIEIMNCKNLEREIIRHEEKQQISKEKVSKNVNNMKIEHVIFEDEEEDEEEDENQEEEDEEEDEMIITHEDDEKQQQLSVEIIPSDEFETSFFKELCRHPALFFMLLNMVIFNSLAGFAYYCLSLMTPDIFIKVQEDIDRGVDIAMYYGTMISSSAEVLAFFFAICTVPFCRRKTINVVYLFLTIFGFIALAIPVDNNVYLILFSLATRFCIFNATVFQFVLIQESLPTNIRSRGFGTVFAFSRFCVVFSPLFSKVFYDPIDETGVPLHHIGMGLLSLITLISLISMCIHPFETKGKGILDVFGRVQGSADFCGCLYKKKNKSRRKNRSQINNNIDHHHIGEKNGNKKEKKKKEEEENGKNTTSVIESEMDLPLLEYDELVHGDD